MRALRVTLFALVAVALATPATAASFRVTSSAEDLDVKPGDGVCATAGGACTIRAALEEADALHVPTEIVRPAVADRSRTITVRSIAPRTRPRGTIVTLIVDTTIDAPDAAPGDGVCATVDGACSLRAAIMEANDLPEPQAIALPAGHYTLVAADPDEDESLVGDLDVLDELTITGAGADVTTIDGDDAGRVLDNFSRLVVVGTTITGGTPEGLRGWFATMELTDCDILHNATGIHQRSFNLMVSGGRIAENDETAYLLGCSVEVDGTTVEDNGAGINFDLNNRGTVKHATFVGNGGVAFFGLGNQVAFEAVDIHENAGGLIIGFTDWASNVTINDSLIERNTSAAVDLNSGSIGISNTTVRDNGGCAIAAGSVDGGSLSVTNSVLERNACGVDVGTTARRYTASIVGSAIIDNRGVGLSASGSAGDPGTSVTITRSTIARNGGGGLYGEGVNGSGPFVTVIDSTISGNQAERGGGILITGDRRTRPVFTLVNSTVSGNSAPIGDGILNEAGDLDLRNVTIAGDGLFIDTDGSAVMRNTILAGGCHGTFESAGYNLIAPNTGCAITGDTTGNQSAPALLDPLADNGGPTRTHALGPASPARDGGNPAGCVDADDETLLADQRGVTRPQGSRCDVGAFEATCGNGTLDDGETCDDGNTNDGDCCTARCQQSGNGASCSDGNACTLDDTCQAGVCTAGADQQCGPCLACLPEGGCVAEPWTGCRQPTERLSGELEIVAKPNRRSIEWSWVQGEATSRDELGNPLADDRYSFCVYDESAAAPRIAFAATTRTDPCGKKSCWKPTGKTGFQYSAPTSDLLRKVVLKSGAQGKAKVLVTAKGDQLVLPTLPMTLPLRAQVQAENGQCWESEFDARGVSKNDAKHFRAKASLP